MNRLLLSALFLFFATGSYSQSVTSIEAVTKDGRTAILKTDGTWEFKRGVPMPSPVEANPNSSGISKQNTSQTLSNKDVVDLVKLGLAPDIITAKIKNSACAFDTSIPALQELKAVNVPDAVILAMVESPSGNTKNAIAPVNGSSDEYGKPEELKGITVIFVDTGSDLKAHEKIVKEIREKLPSLIIADSAEKAEVILVYSEHERPRLANGTTIVPIIAGGGRVVRPLGENKVRILMDYKGTDKGLFDDAVSLKFAKEFIKVYLKANK